MLEIVFTKAREFGGLIFGTKPEEPDIARSVLVTDQGALKVADHIVKPYEDDDLSIALAGLVYEAIEWTPGEDGQIVTGHCAVAGFRVAAGTNPTLALYDGEDTSGTPIFVGAGTLTVGQFYPILGGAGGVAASAARCPNGLYGDVGGTDPSFIIYVIRSQPE